MSPEQSDSISPPPSSGDPRGRGFHYGSTTCEKEGVRKQETSVASPPHSCSLRWSFGLSPDLSDNQEGKPRLRAPGRGPARAAHRASASRGHARSWPGSGVTWEHVRIWCTCSWSPGGPREGLGKGGQVTVSLRETGVRTVWTEKSSAGFHWGTCSKGAGNQVRDRENRKRNKRPQSGTTQKPQQRSR